MSIRAKLGASGRAAPRVPPSNGSGPLSNAVPLDVVNPGSESAGVSGESSRADHQHAHGDLAGGTLHAVATTLAAGFMSAADKLLSDEIALAYDLEHFGDGSDGNVTISGGTTTLTRNMYYNSLDSDGTGFLDTNGFRVFVRDTLDLGSFQSGGIVNNGNNGGASGGTGAGTAGAAISNSELGGSTAGGAGAAGGVGAGAAGTNGVTQGVGNGGAGAAGGAGGMGAVLAGGAGGAAGAVTNSSFIRYWTDRVMRGAVIIGGGAGGGGGGAGGGDGSTGGGGGGGGGGAPCIWISARTIDLSATIDPIHCMGGDGGDGGSPAAGNAGGGGGGAGGGGGWIWLAYWDATGAGTCTIRATGGVGGDGATGTGTGVAGTGGTGGTGGRINSLRLSAGTQTQTDGVAGSGPAGVTGGAGGVCDFALAA